MELPGAGALELCRKRMAGKNPAMGRTSGFCKTVRELVMLRRNKLLNNKKLGLP
jgi:hypothetical protein